MISKVSSEETKFSPVKTMAKGATAGVAVAGLYKAGEKIVPAAKDSFTKSIQKQQGLIDNIKSRVFGENGSKVPDMPFAKKIEKYITAKNNTIQKLSDAQKVYDDIGKIIGYDKANIEKLEGAKLQVYEKLCKSHDELATKGFKAIRKEIAAEEKLLKRGKPSKLTAVKDTVVDLAGKTANKAKSAKESIKNILGGLKEQKLGYIKSNKEGILKTAKKVGIPALIGAATLTAFTLIKNKVSKDN